jgi:hypothetical protein
MDASHPNLEIMALQVWDLYNFLLKQSDFFLDLHNGVGCYKQAVDHKINGVFLTHFKPRLIFSKFSQNLGSVTFKGRLIFCW